MKMIKNMNKETMKHLHAVIENHFWDEYESYLEYPSFNVDKKISDKVDYLLRNNASVSEVMEAIPNHLHNKEHIFYSWYNLCYSDFVDSSYRYMDVTNKK